MQVGVDEAGKGPVLGSMFVAAVRAERDALPDDVTDSKRLSPERRTALDERIRAAASAVTVVEVPVERIDDPETDMNGLAVQGHASALAAVGTDGTDGAACYLDAADTDAERFGRRVADAIDDAVDGDPTVTATHGAETEYPCVAAASIVAKVARDAHVRDLADEYGDLGSGYPGDETTRSFLDEYVAEHGRLPDCARSSWQTSRDVLAAHEQSTMGEF